MPELRCPRPLTPAWDATPHQRDQLAGLLAGLALTNVPAQHGACYDHPDPELWSPGATKRGPLSGQEIAQRTAKAKALCRRCDIKAECLALGRGEQGIWGGLTDDERRFIGAY